MVEGDFLSSPPVACTKPVAGAFLDGITQSVQGGQASRLITLRHATSRVIV
jgi:hypothetical protein